MLEDAALVSVRFPLATLFRDDKFQKRTQQSNSLIYDLDRRLILTE